MPENAVVVVAIGKSKIWDICRKTVENYCNRYHIPLEIIEKREYSNESDGWEKTLFEKYQIYNLFKKYKRILRLDWDILIKPDCPNLFEIVPEDSIGGVDEYRGSQKKFRKRLIKKIQEEFGDIGWRNRYLNSGVLLASRQHKEIFYTGEKETQIYENNNISLKEQTYMNYLINKLNFKIYPLSYRFNHIRLFSESWNNYANRFNSYIIHYASKGIFDKELKITNKLQQVKMDYKIIHNSKYRKKYELFLKYRKGIKYKFNRWFGKVIEKLKGKGFLKKDHKLLKYIYQFTPYYKNKKEIKERKKHKHQKGVKNIMSKIFNNEYKVHNGNFKGMKYIKKSAGSRLLPKILGSYEEPIQHWIKDIIASRKYKYILDIGCAEGYYAAGFAYRLPKTKIIGYDIDINARKYANVLKSINDLSNLQIKSNCTYEELNSKCKNEDTLVFCDIEGSEIDLLDLGKIPNLQNVDLIVESHDSINKNTTEILINRFYKTHRIEIVVDYGIRLNNYNTPNECSREVFYKITNEKRPKKMKYLYLRRFI